VTGANVVENYMIAATIDTLAISNPLKKKDLKGPGCLA